MARFDPNPCRRPESNYSTDGGRIRTGGALVALTASDGVVVVADTRTSHGSVVSGVRVERITQVHPTAVVGSTDDLGAVRSFVQGIRSEVERYENRRGDPMDVRALGTLVVEELGFRSVSDATFVLGGVDDEGTHVLRIGEREGVLEDRYTAVGSGSQFANGVLDAAETQSLVLGEARRLAGRAIESAVERDVGTDGGVHLAEVTVDGVKTYRYDSVDELV